MIEKNTLKAPKRAREQRYPPKVINKEITVYWHPEQKVWTPHRGVEITFEVLGTYSRRSGDRVWVTDAIYSEAIPEDLSDRQLKNLRDSIRSVLSLDEEADVIRVIEPDVINLDKV